MAWNEPGRGQDPWRGRRSASNGIDDALANLQQRLANLFGGGGDPSENRKTAALLAAAVLLVWALFGYYQIDDAQRGVVQRFGAFVEVTEPGLHWRVPWPVDTVAKIDVSAVRTYDDKTVMLTADENVVSIDIEIQYRAADAKAFLFNVRNPEDTLGEVTNSAIREVIGKTGIDQILEGSASAEIAANALKLTQTTLDAYGTGIVVQNFNLRKIQLPDQVGDAVRDAIRAREDKEKQVLAAEAYSNDVLPKARGQAARDIQEAEAYRSKVVAQAEGETARFLRLLAEYQKAPGVTRERLYLETLEQVLGANAKVVVDAKGGGQMLYLPLDQLRRGTPPPMQPDAAPAATATSANENARPTDGRGRGGR